MNPLIVIPARLASTRLPNKPLADIHGLPMIVHVLRCAAAAKVGPVIVACGDEAIFDAVTAAGGAAVMTDPYLPSGTDRVRAAADIVDPDKQHDVVVNVQGDMPTLDPALVQTVINKLRDHPACDIATAAVETDDAREIEDPNVVKAVIAENGHALYFSRRAVPGGNGPILHHVGIYAYRRAALDRFCVLPQSPLERRESLEQLRALEAGMRIDVAVVDTAPDGVDTPGDLDRARALIGAAK